mmetsp:Transcript_18452/g.56636  ORF Transcript_18452/g.56636 Transcript_18452/m.56636 type:complete len:330 (+) Transcript_18452:1757-2746(+)
MAFFRRRRRRDRDLGGRGRDAPGRGEEFSLRRYASGSRRRRRRRRHGRRRRVRAGALLARRGGALLAGRGAGGKGDGRGRQVLGRRVLLAEEVDARPLCSDVGVGGARRQQRFVRRERVSVLRAALDDAEAGHAREAARDDGRVGVVRVQGVDLLSESEAPVGESRDVVALVVFGHAVPHDEFEHGLLAALAVHEGDTNGPRALFDGPAHFVERQDAIQVVDVVVVANRHALSVHLDELVRGVQLPLVRLRQQHVLDRQRAPRAAPAARRVRPPPRQRYRKPEPLLLKRHFVRLPLRHRRRHVRVHRVAGDVLRRLLRWVSLSLRGTRE